MNKLDAIKDSLEIRQEAIKHCRELRMCYTPLSQAEVAALALLPVVEAAKELAAAVYTGRKHEIEWHRVALLEALAELEKE